VYYPFLISPKEEEMPDGPELINTQYERSHYCGPHISRLNLTFDLGSGYPHPGKILEVTIELKGLGGSFTEQRVAIPLNLFFQKGRQVQEYLPGPLPGLAAEGGD
jgi:hypothetical protein